METYQQLLKLLIQANQACPKIAGKIFKCPEGKGYGKIIEIIPGKQAKLGILIRCFILVLVSCSMVLRIGYLQLNKTNGNSNPSEKLCMNLCVLTFFIAIVNAERYRVRGYFPEKFVLIINSLYVIKVRYFKGKNTIKYCADL